MKTIYQTLTATILFVASIQLASGSQISTETSTSTPVYHINKNHEWETMNIEGISTIYQIVSAGKYAWAAGVNHVGTNNDSVEALIFYNGESWSPMQLPSGLSSYGLDLGYPDSGEKPIFWSWKLDGPQESAQLDYFDGEKWIKYDDKFNIHLSYVNFGGKQERITATSSGNFWALQNITASNEFPRHYDTTLEVINKSDPLHPKLITLKDEILIGDLVSDIDGYPYMYAFVVPCKAGETPTVANLTRFDADGNGVIIRENVKIEDAKLFTITSPTLYVHANNILVMQAPDLNIFSPDAGKTWVSNPYFSKHPVEIINKNICYVDDSDKLLNCYDATQVNADVKSLPIQELGCPEVRMTPTEIWYQETHDGFEKIIRFNPTTFEMKDTEVSKYASYVEYEKPLADGKSLATGKDYDGKNTAFYYDGTKWLSQPMGDGLYCALGYAGHAGDSYVNNENIWAYGFKWPPYPNANLKKVPYNSAEAHIEVNDEYGYIPQIDKRSVKPGNK